MNIGVRVRVRVKVRLRVRVRAVGGLSLPLFAITVSAPSLPRPWRSFASKASAPVRRQPLHWEVRWVGPACERGSYRSPFEMSQLPLDAAHTCRESHGITITSKLAGLEVHKGGFRAHMQIELVSIESRPLARP